jgi:hypothetical protein
MSNKPFILTITDDAVLRKQIRGSIPLREKQIHRNRREKRQGKWWNNPNKWEQE